jgi:ribose-phosphate pyrophosphokinase
MHQAPELVFAPAASRMLGEQVAAALGTDLAPLEEREFEAGEHKSRPLVEVRRRSCWIIQTLRGDTSGSANDRLLRALFLIATLRDAGAARVSACLPYLAYGRKERRTKARDPVMTRYVAQLLEAMGVNRVVALEVHDLAAFDNAFRCEAIPLTFAPLVIDALRIGSSDDLTVVSPDIGGAKRAQLVAELIADRFGTEVGFAFLEKRRRGGTVTGDTLVGPVRDRRVLIVDDLIASGSTVLRAVAACRAAGASRIEAAACHAVMSDEAQRLLGTDGPDRLLISNSTFLPAWCTASPRVEVLDAAPLIAECIKRLARGDALTELVSTRDQ